MKTKMFCWIKDVLSRYKNILIFGPIKTVFFKTNKMCKNAVKKLPFVIRYVPYQYVTHEMCHKVILENGGN